MKALPKTLLYEWQLFAVILLGVAVILFRRDELLVVIHSVNFYCFPCINGVYWSVIMVSPSSSCVPLLSNDCFKYSLVVYIINNYDC